MIAHQGFADYRLSQPGQSSPSTEGPGMFKNITRQGRAVEPIRRRPWRLGYRVKPTRLRYARGFERILCDRAGDIPGVEASGRQIAHIFTNGI